jgi:trk system potassium uptake protein TrkH
MTEQISALSYAIRLPVVGKFFGQLNLALAALTLVPLLVSVFYTEFDVTVRYLIIIVVLLLLGIPLARLEKPTHLQINEGLAISAFIFIFAPLVLIIPIMGAGLNVLDAFFEAVSAITTTGLSTLETIEDKPKALGFARAWIQWVGGLGIIVLSTAFLIGPGAVAKRLVQIEGESEDVAGTTQTLARRVLVIYTSITLFGILLLWALGADLYSSVTHTLAAISTGGFSTFNDSLSGFSHWWLPAAVMLISFSGSIPLLLYYRGYRQGWTKILANLQLRAMFFAGLFVAVILSISITMELGIPFAEAIKHGLLLAFSAQTTTGFSTLSVADLDQASKLILIVSMAVGGGLGSTAGGIKILRFLILMRVLQLLIQRTRMPRHAVVESNLGGEHLGKSEIQRALLVILLFVIIILVSWLPFLAFGYEPINALFEVVSACATVGLSTGISDSHLPPLLKFVLCFDMLAGRLEIIALLVLLYPGTWFGKRTT